MWIDFNWPVLGPQLEKIGLAFVLAIPLGIEREREQHSVGLRTFPLVSVASCSYILVASATMRTDPGGASRVLQGVVAGIGFIGGGAILKENGAIRGTATAAGIWNTGAIGAAVALDQWGIAAMLALVNLLVLHFLMPLKRWMEDRKL